MFSDGLKMSAREPSASEHLIAELPEANPDVRNLTA